LADNGEQYVVQLFNTVSGCTFNTPPLTVSVVGQVQVTLDATQAGEGSPFTITATTAQPVTSYQWFYEGAIIGGQSASTLTDTRAGTYESTVTLAGCTDTEEIRVLLAPLTSGKMVDRVLICDDPANTDPNTNQVVLDPGPNFTSYDWFKDGVSLGIMDPTYTATEGGLYSVDLVNVFGCDSNDKTQVDIECLPKITGPNAFRPSGINDNFFLYTFFIDDTDFQVYIFNRWGEMIYQSTDRTFKWNGGYNNTLSKPAPPGTYTYLVKYKSSYRPQDGVKEKRGGVVLLR
jgi:gliding motility-associated-like protein